MRTRMYGGVRGRKTKVGGKPTFVFLLLDSLLLEVFFTDSTGRTYPILRKIFKCGSGSNSALRIALCRVVDVPADNANIPIHNFTISPSVYQFPDQRVITAVLKALDSLNCQSGAL